jgi:hypothetical protein
MNHNPQKIELAGLQFGRLLVIRFSHTSSKQKAYWICLCTCGTTKVVQAYQLRSGHTTSCGCFHRENTGQINFVHGGSGTRLHRIWKHMIDRCERTSGKDFRWYGARGISVCAEWRHDFAAFREWALRHGYADDLTIDRIHSDQDYSPLNCQWITAIENVKKMHREKAVTVGVREYRTAPSFHFGEQPQAGDTA